MDTVTMIELEEKLRRMREQGADDNTPVEVVYGGESRRLREVRARVQGGNQGRRVVELRG